MKKFLLILTILILTLPAFANSDMGLLCTYVPAGSNEYIFLESLYFSSDNKVYNSSNNTVGKINAITNSALTATVYDGDILVYLFDTKMSTYTYKDNNIKATAYGSCKSMQ
ncbi:hypothetical protein IJG14_07080 [bacterium]|nr:hypothetical protein [bacterium]